MSSHTAQPPKFLGNLTGVSFRRAEAKVVVYEQIKPGDTFRLERDPTNAHDENAVKVLFDQRRPMTIEEYYGDIQIFVGGDDLSVAEEQKRLSTSVDDIIFCGFIERGVAASLARWMDEGWVYIARAKARIDHKMTPWLLEIEPTGERKVPHSYTSLESRNAPNETPNDVGFSALDDDIPF